MTLFSVRKTHLTRIVQHDRFAKDTCIHRSSVVRIIRDQLRLKCVKKHYAQELSEANCITRLSRTKKLLSKFLESAVNFIFFTDEKVFQLHHL